MNSNHLFVAATLALAATILRGSPILLDDDFSGATLDTSKWTVILPQSSSSVVQSGGAVTTTARGILATNDGFSGGYSVSGMFTLLDPFEHFNIALRTDLSSTNSHHERAGLIVTFVNDGDGISIQELTNPIDDWRQVGTTGGGGFSLHTGQSYAFNILDTGTSVSVSVDGSLVLSADSTYGTGDRIAFYSREFGTTETRIDALTIAAVPEYGATWIMLAIGVAALVGLRNASDLRRSSAR